MEKTPEFLVTHQGNLYDIGPFLSKHPGGIAHLEPYRGRSVSSLLKKGHGDSDEAASALIHSDAARYILREYQVDAKLISDKRKNGTVSNGIKQNGQINGIKKVNGIKHEDQSTEVQDETEDLEYLVDWDKPMLGQVGALGKNYMTWVNLPVDRDLKMFSNPYLEKATKSKWLFVPIVWVPVMFGFLTLHFHAGHTWDSAIIGVIMGIFAWTLLEYTLHRWVFHLNFGNSPTLITLHFLIHGLHHKVPFDSSRLVFPPIPAAIIGVGIYYIYSSLLTDCLLHSMGAGTTAGYIFYDLCHYYLHFGKPGASTYLYNLKRYHNRHHFSHNDIGYGITSPFWDNIFGTKIMLQKLAKAIKW